MLVQEHIESFLAQVETEGGAALPEFVKTEFDAFLECGILAHGFLRLRCAECADEKLVRVFLQKARLLPLLRRPAHGGNRRPPGRSRDPVRPVRQWVMSFPIPLRILFAAQPQLLAPLLQVIHRVIASFLLKRAGLKRTAASTDAVTLIQRFGSAANLNIHLHCLVLDGVYRNSTAVFHEVAAPTSEELQALLAKIITRIMRLLTKHGFLSEEQDRTYLAEADRESALLPLQAASCTYRIALGPRAGQKVLSLHSLPSAEKSPTPELCAKLHGFTLHAAVRWGADQRKELEHLCRYITRPASPMNGSSVTAPAKSCCN